MNNRIKDLRTIYLKEKTGKKCTQQEFADRLGLSQNFIWQIEKGEREPSDRTISDICREFGVDRVWLETGKGEPFVKISREEELRAVFADVLAGTETHKNAFIAAIAQLPENVFEVLVESWIQAAEEMKERIKKEE